jgi:hypothetical protein
MLTRVPASNGMGRGNRTELRMPDAEPVSSPTCWPLKEASSAYALPSGLPPCVTPAAPRPCRIEETQGSGRPGAPAWPSDARATMPLRTRKERFQIAGYANQVTCLGVKGLPPTRTGEPLKRAMRPISRWDLPRPNPSSSGRTKPGLPVRQQITRTWACTIMKKKCGLSS